MIMTMIVRRSEEKWRIFYKDEDDRRARVSHRDVDLEAVPEDNPPLRGVDLLLLAVLQGVQWRHQHAPVQGAVNSALRETLGDQADILKAFAIWKPNYVVDGGRKLKFSFMRQE